MAGLASVGQVHLHHGSRSSVSSPAGSGAETARADAEARNAGALVAALAPVFDGPSGLEHAAKRQAWEPLLQLAASRSRLPDLQSAMGLAISRLFDRASRAAALAAELHALQLPELPAAEEQMARSVGTAFHSTASGRAGTNYRTSSGGTFGTGTSTDPTPAGEEPGVSGEAESGTEGSGATGETGETSGETGGETDEGGGDAGGGGPDDGGESGGDTGDGDTGDGGTTGGDTGGGDTGSGDTGDDGGLGGVIDGLIGGLLP